jgi:sialate O-acetylesterase
MPSHPRAPLLLTFCWCLLSSQFCHALQNSFLREDREPTPSLEDTALYATDDEQRHFVSATLGSNMVLQRDRPAMIWGFSQPGANITTVLQKGHYDPYPSLTTTVDSTGLWRQPLPLQNASRVPHTIDIHSTTGEAACLDNVLFGDVYLCSGQSNMQFTLDGTTNGQQEAKDGNNYPHIRIFTVGQLTSSPGKELLDLQTVEQQWTVANEQSLYSYGDQYFAFGYFSSVCWFFGKQVADGLDNQVPIGLISSNWGGTKVELWQVGGYLYNAMIHPYMVGPMALAGFTWYQGEANAENQTTADSYAQTFPQMIQQWRKGFLSPNIYFGFVQLSTWCPPHEPEGVAMLREAQMAAMALPNVGYATNADHGWGCDVHRKYRTGELAQWIEDRTKHFTLTM